MDEYEMKFYKNGVEINLSEMPKEYLKGIVDICRDEIAGEERWERLCENMIK